MVRTVYDYGTIHWRQLEAGFVVDFLANSTTFVGLFSPDFIALLNNFVIIDARLT